MQRVTIFFNVFELFKFFPTQKNEKKRKEILARYSLFFLLLFFDHSEHVISLQGDSRVSSYA